MLSGMICVSDALDRSPTNNSSGDHSLFHSNFRITMEMPRQSGPGEDMRSLAF
jgi:hypothetical protein